MFFLVFSVVNVYTLHVLVDAAWRDVRGRPRGQQPAGSLRHDPRRKQYARGAPLEAVRRRRLAM